MEITSKTNFKVALGSVLIICGTLLSAGYGLHQFLSEKFDAIEKKQNQVLAIVSAAWRVEDQQNWTDEFRGANPGIHAPNPNAIIKQRVIPLVAKKQGE